MTNKIFPLVAVAALALAGCNKQDHTIVQGVPDDMANNSAGAAPIALPPSISSSKIYRCKDQSVVYIDWLSDAKSANFKATKDDTPVVLTAATAGAAMTAEGYSLIGLPTAKSITLTRPGKGEQACKA